MYLPVIPTKLIDYVGSHASFHFCVSIFAIGLIDIMHISRTAKMYPGENKFKRFKMNSKKDIKICRKAIADKKVVVSIPIL